MFNITPEFKGSIAIKDLNGSQLYYKDLVSEKEGNDFLNKHGQSVVGSSLLRSSIIPTKTDSLKNFSKNVFFPTFVNHALKVNGIVPKFFASLAALIWDLLTFSPRVLIATPIKVLYDLRHPSITQPHSLTEIIKDSLPESVTIEVYTKETTIRETPDNTFPKQATTEEKTHRVLINTIPLSGNATKYDRTIKTEMFSFTSIGQFWMRLGIPSTFSQTFSSYSC